MGSGGQSSPSAARSARKIASALFAKQMSQSPTKSPSRESSQSSRSLRSRDKRPVLAEDDDDFSEDDFQPMRHSSSRSRRSAPVDMYVRPSRGGTRAIVVDPESSDEDDDSQHDDEDPLTRRRSQRQQDSPQSKRARTESVSPQQAETHESGSRSLRSRRRIVVPDEESDDESHHDGAADDAHDADQAEHAEEGVHTPATTRQLRERRPPPPVFYEEEHEEEVPIYTPTTREGLRQRRAINYNDNGDTLPARRSHASSERQHRHESRQSRQKSSRSRSSSRKDSSSRRSRAASPDNDADRYSLRPRRSVNYATIFPSEAEMDRHRQRFPDRRISERSLSAILSSPRKANRFDDSSDDEKHYDRRKGGPMSSSGGSRHAIQPLNMGGDAHLPLGSSSRADVDPLNVVAQTTFESIGGLNHHIAILKEMVLLPLLYPEVFTRFDVAPPRGVLFHGPPGTGKTLMARALANSATIGVPGVGGAPRQISFFMRKGADCLSKWVGEAERQLRLLFEQAQAMQPSIIFFDEIDGLAPVRSSKQEQVHSSIVSTLLALMDGLDSRGQVIVIGATNRIDAIDPALRRPGRFDREFFFSLPDAVARRSIIDIHTSKWSPPLEDGFKAELAEATKGFGGADIRALCTDAALKAVKRHYPQIYESSERLLIHPDQIRVRRDDFAEALRGITPSSRRSAEHPGRPLPLLMAPLLKDAVAAGSAAVLEKLMIAERTAPAGGRAPETTEFVTLESLLRREDEWSGDGATSLLQDKPFSVFRPRLLVQGPGAADIGAAVLHSFTSLFIQSFDMSSLLAADGLRGADATALALLRELSKRQPAIAYLPHIDRWAATAPDAVVSALVDAFETLPAEERVLLLATSETTGACEVTERLFSGRSMAARVTASPPGVDARRAFFESLSALLFRPPAGFKLADDGSETLIEIVKVPPPPLPKAPALPKPRVSAEERRARERADEDTLRELRIDLRIATDELLKVRKFAPFHKPVDPEVLPDYYEIIEHPMDLTTMMSKIDEGVYSLPDEYLADIDLILSNAREFNPRHDPERIVNRARAMKDIATQMVSKLIEPDLLSRCMALAARRKREASPEKNLGPRHSRRLRGEMPDRVDEVPAELDARRKTAKKIVKGAEEEDKVEKEGDGNDKEVDEEDKEEKEEEENEEDEKDEEEKEAEDDDEEKEEEEAEEVAEEDDEEKEEEEEKEDDANAVASDSASEDEKEESEEDEEIAPRGEDAMEVDAEEQDEEEADADDDQPMADDDEQTAATAAAEETTPAEEPATPPAPKEMPFIIDRARWELTLDALAKGTASYDLDELRALHTRCAQAILAFAASNDRTGALDRLAAITHALN